MGKPVSITEGHLAECERLRRIRECAPIMVHVELDEPEVAFLADMCDLAGHERNEPKFVGAALKTWLRFNMKEFSK